MRKTLISVAVIATVLLSSLAVFTIVGGSITQDAPLGPRLLSCIPAGAWQSGSQLIPRDTSCAAGVMLDALKAKSIQDIEPTMLRMGTSEKLQTLCHEAAHAAGQQLFSEIRDWRKSVQAADRLVCNSGLLHGVFDGLAKTKVPQNEWVGIAAWCSEISKRQDGQGNCGDAIGHAAWDTSRTSKKALAVCALLSVDFLASQCAEGVVMQQFTPASRLEESIPIPKESVLEVCAASVGLTTPLRSGCLNGVGYVAASLLELQAQDGSYLAGKSLAAVVSDGLSYCTPFATEASECRLRYWQTIFYRLYRLPNPIDNVCSAVKIHEQLCRESLKGFKVS